MPRIAKIVKKKMARPIIPPKDIIDLNNVSTRIYIDFTLFKERSGLNKRKVLNPDILLRYDSSSEDITTIKSSQFKNIL